MDWNEDVELGRKGEVNTWNRERERESDGGMQCVEESDGEMQCVEWAWAEYANKEV